MKNITIIYSLFALILLSSCGDSFSTVVDVELPEADKKLAVHLDLKLGTNDTSYFNVVKSLSELSNNNEGEINYDDLQVNIKNETTGSTIPIYDDLLFSAYQIKYIINEDYIEGQEYSIELTYPEYEVASAKAVVPANPPALTNIGLKRTKGTNFDSEEEVSRLTITLKDPPEQNYYRLRVQLADQIVGLAANGDTVSIETTKPSTYNFAFSDDPSVFATDNGILISDKSFNGTTKELTLDLESFSTFFEYFGGVESTFIKQGKGGMYFEQISKERYNFDRSFETHKQSDGGPFSTPVTVFSNIENGHGIFSISNGKEYQISY